MDPLAEAFTAYLEPLWTKHALEQPIFWEDLEAAYERAKATFRSKKDSSTMRVGGGVHGDNLPTENRP
jgi:hypothetical protein